MSLSHEDVREILRLLDSTPYDELRLETERFRLFLRRADSGGWVEEAQVLARPGSAPDAREAAVGPDGRERAAEGDRGNRTDAAGGDGTDVAGGARPAVGVAGADAAGGGGLAAVRAPLMGVFYRAPKPGAPPFVEVGGFVEPETVVGIVETMKLMNPVYAGVRGTVVEICLADAEPAEQDAVLMRVRPEPS